MILVGLGFMAVGIYIWFPSGNQTPNPVGLIPGFIGFFSTFFGLSGYVPYCWSFCKDKYESRFSSH